MKILLFYFFFNLNYTERNISIFVRILFWRGKSNVGKKGKCCLSSKDIEIFIIGF